MIDINITLFIQVIHFLIGYWIITTFLLKPVYAVIVKQDADTDLLMKDIGENQEAILNINWDTFEHWQRCQQFFKKEAPPANQIQLFIFRNVVPSRQITEIEKSQVEKKTDEIAQNIMKEIAHVRL